VSPANGPARRPAAVLLDAGGVFFLPTPARIVAAFARAECRVAAEICERAHFTGASRFTTDLDVEADWAGCWRGYLDAYIDTCDVGDADRDEIHRHLDSEFADAGLWLEVVAGARDGLRALADTGLRLGVVSNADGLISERLREHELAQVGPGVGVRIECVIDSGAVGVMKPDPRIFELALDAMGLDAADAWYVGDMPAIDVVGARRAGLHPVLMDPFALHHDADYDRVASLGELAGRLAA
jgi:putative hydrolase of the HAD superfamily